MEKVTLAMVGAGGFARTYLNALWGNINPEEYDLVGIIDPYASASTLYAEIMARGIPVYDTLEDFYRVHSAQLVCIASPVYAHMEQIRTAFAHGSHVLCEKPLTVFAEDVAKLEEEAQKAGLLLGVGFQWSFSRRVRALKKDILDGRLGKPVALKTLISWMRSDAYFQKWHGHMYAPDGSLLLDSIISNAMAHYLHFGLFLLGDRMDTARMPSRVKASLYRAKDITTFDTCSVKCFFEDDVTHSLYLTHSADRDRYLSIEMTFEKAVATILMDYGETDGHLRVAFEDGSMIDYDSVGERDVTVEKLCDMMEACRHPEGGIPCHAATTLPFSNVCNSLFAEVPIHLFPKEMVYHSEGYNPGQYVRGLYAQLTDCFLQDKSPYELGYSWAVPDTEYELKSPEENAKRLREVLL